MVADEIIYDSRGINWDHPDSNRIYKELLLPLYVDLLKRKLIGESVRLVQSLLDVSKKHLSEIGVPEERVTRGVIGWLMHPRGKFASDGIPSLKYWRNNGGIIAFEEYLQDLDIKVIDSTPYVSPTELEIEETEEIFPAEELSLIERIENADHTHEIIAYLLCRIGQARGEDVWLSHRTKVINSIRELNMLGFEVEESELENQTLSEFPQLSSEEFNKIAREIDVIFFNRNTGTPTYYFEIETTPIIYSGLLRLNDVKLSPIELKNPRIISAERNRTKFEKEKNRYTFRHSRLSENVQFRNYQNILTQYEVILVQL